jgi:hypothetical protein
VLQPAYDDAAGILGGTCSATAACGMGLTCAMGSDNTARCYESCTPPTCTNGGKCMLGIDGMSDGCIF